MKISCVKGEHINEDELRICGSRFNTSEVELCSEFVLRHLEGWIGLSHGPN